MMVFGCDWRLAVRAAELCVVVDDVRAFRCHVGLCLNVLDYVIPWDDWTVWSATKDDGVGMPVDACSVREHRLDRCWAVIV